MKVENMEDEIRSYARLAGLKASSKTFSQLGEQDSPHYWWFSNNAGVLQSDERGMDDKKALEWLKEEWEYRQSLADHIHVSYTLADYLPEGIKLDANTVYEIQIAIEDNVAWSVTDDSKVIENDIREYVKELLEERNIPPA